MSEGGGRTVRLFLVEGSPAGLFTAEIMNWTGHVLAGPRSGLNKFLARPELDRTGIYFLFGRAPEDPDTASVYIGESDNVRKRLTRHNVSEDNAFWERTCVVTSKDQNITKAHGRYLESRLIAIAAEAGRASLANSTAQPPQPLPEADQSDMEFFIGQIRLILPVLGFEFLRAKPKVSRPETLSPAPAQSPTAENPVFEIVSRKWNLKAEAVEVGDEFVVLAGSQAVTAWQQSRSHRHNYSKLHDRLVQQGKLKVEGAGDLATFQEDTPFSSPSAASAIVFGRADNGRTSWRVKGQNITYGDWQARQVAEADTGEPVSEVSA